MLSLLFFIPCEKAVLDVFTNKVTLVSVADSIVGIPFEYRPDMPERLKESRFLIPPLTLVATWNSEMGDETKYEQKITIVAPDGRESPLGSTMEFNMESGGNRVYQEVGPIAGRIFGESVFVLSVRELGQGEEDWKKVAEYPLFVEDIPEPPSDLPDSKPESES